MAFKILEEADSGCRFRDKRESVSYAFKEAIPIT